MENGRKRNSHPSPAGPVDALEAELAAAERYADSALAPATRKAYASDWHAFATWCAQRGQRPLPATPASVAAFLATEADRELRPVTITRRAAATAAAHRAPRTAHRAPRQDYLNPCDTAVAQLLTGTRCSDETDTRQVDPLALGPLAQLLEPIATDTLRPA